MSHTGTRRAGRPSRAGLRPPRIRAFLARVSVLAGPTPGWGSIAQRPPPGGVAAKSRTRLRCGPAQWTLTALGAAKFPTQQRQARRNGSWPHPARKVPMWPPTGCARVEVCRAAPASTPVHRPTALPVHRPTVLATEHPTPASCRAIHGRCGVPRPGGVARPVRRSQAGGAQPGRWNTTRPVGRSQAGRSVAKPVTAQPRPGAAQPMPGTA